MFKRCVRASVHTGLLIAALLFPMLSTAAPTSFDDYSSRIRRAVTALDAIAHGDEKEEMTDFEDRFRSTILQVREFMPPTESVIVDGSIFEIDNRWLDDGLKATLEMREDDANRLNTLYALTERLRSLGEALTERDDPEAQNDKDANKARMASILRRPEYNDKSASESAFQRVWQQFLNWLRYIFPEAKPIAPGSVRGLSRAAQLIVIGIAAAVILLALWKGAGFYRHRQRRVKKEKPRERVVLGERLAPDQTSVDLLSEAESLARAGDLRAAIRKGYIAFLCELGDRKVLRLERANTNRDYLYAVREREKLHENMRALTDSFERHWYGDLPAALDDWADFRAKYSETLNGN
jgi:hypothetical protein